MSRLRCAVSIAATVAMVTLAASAGWPADATTSTAGSRTSATRYTPTLVSAGPVVTGNPLLARQERHCVKRLPHRPWFQTLVRTFNSDANHTGVFPCARFAGSLTGPNKVVAHQTATVYPSPFTTVTRGPGEVYVYGGCNGSNNPPALKSYVAKVKPGTLKQVWKTPLANATRNNDIHLCGSVEALADGSLIATDGHALYKLNGGTGKVTAKRTVPHGKTAPHDTAVNGSDSFPDGTIVLKTWNRVAGCKKNGILAMIKCKGALTGKATPSILSAINPKNLNVLDSVNLGGNISSRISTTSYRGHRYVYVTSAKQLFRYTWNGHTLTKDRSWGPVSYPQPGQIGGGTPTPMNGWIVEDAMGITKPMSVVAVSQADGHILSIQPNTTLPRGQHSTSAAKPTVDPAHNRIYMCDFNLGTCSAVQLRRGQLTMAWKKTMRTQAFTSLIGPPNKRVFVASSMKSATESDPTKYDYGPKGANFTERYQWRDATTGKLLATTRSYPPKAEASQTPPGYGGLIYGLTNNGRLLTLYARPHK